MDRQKLDQLYNAISRATAAPMSKAEALDLLEELEADIEGRIEALKDEIDNED